MIATMFPEYSDCCLPEPIWFVLLSCSYSRLPWASLLSWEDCELSPNLTKPYIFRHPEIHQYIDQEIWLDIHPYLNFSSSVSSMLASACVVLEAGELFAPDNGKTTSEIVCKISQRQLVDYVHTRPRACCLLNMGFLICRSNIKGKRILVCLRLLRQVA